MSKMTEHAQFLAKKYGFRIIPITPGGKNPLFSNWSQKATSDPDQIAKWWEKWPNANIGMVTGGSSGIRCIDLDVDDNTGADGIGVLRRWEAENGQLPESWQDITGRGGCHYYFHSDRKIPNNNRTLHEDIEIRSENLVVVLPPSLHPSGRRYQWEAGCAPWEIPIAEADDILLKFVMPPDEKKQQLSLPATIDQGCREWTLYRAACSMQGTGFSDAAINAAIRTENSTSCNPPLEEKELKQLIGSALKKPKGKKVSQWIRDGQEMQAWILQELQDQL